MQLGDRVYFKTFGDGNTNHLQGEPLTISHRMRPEKAAGLVKNRISRLPATTHGEGSTNIIAFLENSYFDCSKEGSALWLLTDGIEFSIDFDGKELLKGKKLPAPYKQTLQGCDVVMIGVGRLSNGARLPREQIHHLNSAWIEWLNAAGAKSVEMLVDPKL